MLSLVKNEQQIIACLVDQPSLIDLIEDDYFVSSTGSALYHALKELSDSTVEFSVTNIVSAGNRRNDSIDETLVANLLQTERSVESFQTYYYPRLKKDFAKWTIENTLLRDILSETSTKGDLNVTKLQDLTIEILKNLDMIEGKSSIVYSAQELLERYRSVIVRRSSGELHYSFGDSFLDRAIVEGAAPGKITKIFGATGVGKSAYALNLVMRCTNKQIPCVYDSLEMDGISTMDRLIAMKHRFPYHFLFPDEEGTIPSFVFEALEYERRQIEKNRSFYFVEEPSQKVDDIRTIAREAKRRAGSDYLIFFADLWTMFRDSGDDPREMETAMNQLHEIVKQENIHFVGVVQANREVEHHRPRDLHDLDRFRPSLNNIKNSGAMAERARVVLSVFRPKYYATRFFGDHEDFQDEVEAMDDVGIISILKQNAGELRSLYYQFFPELYLYYPTTRDQVQGGV